MGPHRPSRFSGSHLGTCRRVGSRRLSDHHDGEGESEAKEADAFELLSHPGGQGPEVTGSWARGGGWQVREKMEPELVGEHEPPHKKQNGATNLLLSAKQITQAGRSGKAEGGGEWEDEVWRKGAGRKRDVGEAGRRGKQDDAGSSLLFPSAPLSRRTMKAASSPRRCQPTGSSSSLLSTYKSQALCEALPPL